MSTINYVVVPAKHLNRLTTFALLGAGIAGFAYGRKLQKSIDSRK